MRKLIESKVIDGKYCLRLEGVNEGTFHSFEHPVDALLWHCEMQLQTYRSYMLREAGIDHASVTRVRRNDYGISARWLQRLCHLTGIPFEELEKAAFIEPHCTPHPRARKPEGEVNGNLHIHKIR
jgi:hypothetical protein